MTCVLASPWNPLSTSLSWSSMNPNPSDSLHSGLERSQSHGYASSGSEQPKKSGSTKKRASRAGTRSVSTLSAAQLERKRANDREAQRAIRQRTKDHIDGLENTISELRRSQEASERDALAARQRNRELEDENAFIRMKLSEAGLSADLPPQSESSKIHVQTNSVYGQFLLTKTSFSPSRPISLSSPCFIRGASVRCKHTTSSVDIDVPQFLWNAPRRLWFMASTATKLAPRQLCRPHHVTTCSASQRICTVARTHDMAVS